MRLEPGTPRVIWTYRVLLGYATDRVRPKEDKRARQIDEKAAAVDDGSDGSGLRGENMLGFAVGRVEVKRINAR